MRLSPKPASTAEQPANPVPVLYIGGFGRSGSTLLDRLLGNVPQLHSGGEIAGIWPQGLISDRLCSCGVRFSECPFWTVVGKSSFGTLNVEEVDAIASYLRHTFPAKKMWRLFLPRTRANLIAAAPENFLDVTAQIYEGMREVSACQAVVDSSKLATYLLMLAQVPSLRLHVVHLVRDPRAVAHSWSRPIVPDPDGRSSIGRFGAVKSALLWMIINIALEWTARRLDLPYLRIRYEDLVACPDQVVDQLRRQVSTDLPGTASPAAPAGGEVELDVVHSVSGNPMRFAQGRVAIVEDASWKGDGRAKRAITSAITFPLQWRYGYRALRRPVAEASGRAVATDS